MRHPVFSKLKTLDQLLVQFNNQGQLGQLGQSELISHPPDQLNTGEPTLL